MFCAQQVLRMESQVFQGEAVISLLPAAAGQVLEAGWSELPAQGGNLRFRECPDSLHQFPFSFLHGPLLVFCSAATGFSNLGGVRWTLGGLYISTQIKSERWGQLGESCPNVAFSSSHCSELCIPACWFFCLIGQPGLGF